MSIGGPRPSAFYVERQALTRLPATPAAPSGLDSAHAFGQNDPGPGNATPGDGLILAGLMAIVVSVWPQSGATLSGAGTLLCWVFNPYQGQWARCDDLDLDLSTASGFPAKTFSPPKLNSRLGMMVNYLTSGVTVSGGPDVLVRIDGFQSVLGMGT